MAGLGWIALSWVNDQAPDTAGLLGVHRVLKNYGLLHIYACDLSHRGRSRELRDDRRRPSPRGELASDVLLEPGRPSLVLHQVAGTAGELVASAIRLGLFGGCPARRPPTGPAVDPAAGDRLPLGCRAIDADGRHRIGSEGVALTLQGCSDSGRHSCSTCWRSRHQATTSQRGRLPDSRRPARRARRCSRS